MIEADRREVEFLKTFGDGASYHRVKDRVWIGGMGAAVGVATGNIGQFSAVLNASGCELRDGVSIEDIAEKRDVHVHHMTVARLPAGYTLRDDKFFTIDELIQKRIDSGEKDNAMLWVMHNDYEFPIYRTQHHTLASFHVTVMRAADDIHRFLTANMTGDILVHCYAGMNRSASCIMAYLMMYEGIPFDKAKVRSRFTSLSLAYLLIQVYIMNANASRFQIHDKSRVALTNDDFNFALEHLPASLEEAQRILTEEEEVLDLRLHGIEHPMDDESNELVGALCSNDECKKRGARLICSRCMNAQYCSPACAEQHWHCGGHQTKCVDFRN
jgi:hypothetical protein